MIVITAPTGLIGHQVLDNVADADEQIRVIARDPSRLSPETRERVQVVQGSHGGRDVVERVVSISALGREVRRYAGFVSASLAMDDMLAPTGANTRALTMPSFMDNLVPSPSTTCRTSCPMCSTCPCASSRSPVRPTRPP
jgi:nucleoside-diphosphate-sugar epimerase